MINFVAELIAVIRLMNRGGVSGVAAMDIRGYRFWRPV
ncbi:hypothetical protein THPR109532_16100 [Thalassospira profundimaris]